MEVWKAPFLVAFGEACFAEYLFENISPRTMGEIDCYSIVTLIECPSLSDPIAVIL